VAELAATMSAAEFYQRVALLELQNERRSDEAEIRAMTEAEGAARFLNGA